MGVVETRPAITRVIMPNVFVLRQNSMSFIREIRWNKLTVASSLSRSVKVTRNDSDRYAVYDFLLVDLSRTVSAINGN